jgi:Mg/Co/Ni transporter MgtE
MVVRALALKEIGPKDANKGIVERASGIHIAWVVLGFLAFLRVLLTGNPSHLPKQYRF